jgi:hypothetical protein
MRGHSKGHSCYDEFLANFGRLTPQVSPLALDIIFIVILNICLYTLPNPPSKDTWNQIYNE